jgi:methylated-DNA-[protein]-cysteine S-methyltransferase
MKVLQWKMDSKIGSIYLVASSQGLRGVYWRKQIAIPTITSLHATHPETKVLKQAVKELEEYFDGQRKKFEIPLEISGTPFQKKVWGRLSKIPYGKTFSYQDIARQIGNEKASRAVGNANGKNPLCIVLPCHRVIASNGQFGGYVGGLDKKTKLLKLEGLTH